jgi:hypothetical protein
MAVAPSAVTAAILAASPALKGPAWFQMATGLGIGFVAWSINPVNVILVGSVNGTLGSGVVNGKFVLPPVPAPVVAAVSGAGVLGLSAPQIATAVGIGVGTSYSASGQYIGTSVGVGVGPDVSKVVFANPATLQPLLVSGMASQGIVGPAAIQLASGLAAGIATMFLTGFGTGVAAGPTGPAPGTGVSKSSVL